MNEHSAQFFIKLADAGPGWALVAMFIYRLPWIIGATLGTAGLSTVLKHLP